MLGSNGFIYLIVLTKLVGCNYLCDIIQKWQIDLHIRNLKQVYFSIY